MPDGFDKVQQIVKSDARASLDWPLVLFWIGVVLVLWGGGILR